MEENWALPQVLAVWSDVLGTPAGADDNFFALGGDSLGVVKVLSRLEDRLGITVSARVMLETRTAREMADRLEM